MGKQGILYYLYQVTCKHRLKLKEAELEKGTWNWHFHWRATSLLNVRLLKFKITKALPFTDKVVDDRERVCQRLRTWWEKLFCVCEFLFGSSRGLQSVYIPPQVEPVRLSASQHYRPGNRLSSCNSLSHSWIMKWVRPLDKMHITINTALSLFTFDTVDMIKLLKNCFRGVETEKNETALMLFWWRCVWMGANPVECEKKSQQYNTKYRSNVMFVSCFEALFYLLS